MTNLKNKRILIVDDDSLQRELIHDICKMGGATVYSAVDGLEGLQLFFTCQPDLVILDVMMPIMDGYEVCQRMQESANTPIIMLTALNNEQAIVKGLDAGAVDYVTKPYSPRVLLARIRAALRQVTVQPTEKSRHSYHDGYLSIDTAHHRVLVQDKAVKLSAKEHKILLYLFQHAGQILTFQQILNHVWGWEYQDNSDYVHVYISHLRRKLEQKPKQPQYLITEHGVGYRFEKQR